MEAAYKPIVTGELDTQNFEKFPEVSIFAYQTLTVLVSLSREDVVVVN